MVVRGKAYQAGSGLQIVSWGASQGKTLETSTTRGSRGPQRHLSQMRPECGGPLCQSSKYRVELPRRAVLLPHEFDRAPGCGDASRRLGVDASHVAGSSCGVGPHDHGVALYRRLEDGLICRGRLRRHDRCVCEYLLTHSFADDCGDAYRFHWRETARGRRSQGTEISFSSGRPMTFLPEGVLCSSGRTRTLLRRGRAYPSNCVLVHDGYLWQRQVLGRLWHSS